MTKGPPLFADFCRAVAIEAAHDNRFDDADRQDEANFSFCSGFAIGYALGFQISRGEELQRRIADALVYWPTEGPLQ